MNFANVRYRQTVSNASLHRWPGAKLKFYLPVNLSAVAYLDYDNKQNLVPYVVEDPVISNPESIKVSAFALQGFNSGRSRIILEGIYFLPYASLDSTRKRKKLLPGGGEDFNGVGSQLKPQLFLHLVPGYVFFVFWIGQGVLDVLQV